MNLEDMLNAPTDVELDGVVYKLRQPDVIEGATFARWLQQRAREAVAGSVDIPEEDRRQLLRDVTADIVAGIYSWGGPVCIAALQQRDGVAKLLTIILSCTSAIADKIIDRQLAEIIAIIKGMEEDDPKALGQLLVRLGLPSDFLSSSSSSRTRHSTTPSTTSEASASDNSKASTCMSEPEAKGCPNSPHPPAPDSAASGGCSSGDASSSASPNPP